MFIKTNHCAFIQNISFLYLFLLLFLFTFPLLTLLHTQVEQLKKQLTKTSAWTASKPSANANANANNNTASTHAIAPLAVDKGVVEDLKHHLFTWLTLALKFDRMAMRKLCSIPHFPSISTLSFYPHSFLVFSFLSRFSLVSLSFLSRLSSLVSRLSFLLFLSFLAFPSFPKIICFFFLTPQKISTHQYFLKKLQTRMCII
jgi:hypothetical protein